MTMTFVPASPKQESFLQDLVMGREVTEELAGEVLGRLADGTMAKHEASDMIDLLLRLPKKAKSSTPSNSVLAGIPKSKYAIHVQDLELVALEDEFRGDVAFFEVKEYNGTRYMRQLHGAPGNFNRSKLKASTVKAIVGIIEKDPHAYARLFGEHFTCCGSCGAPLTDERSRELMLGPECRKKFGF